jgi:hypothetical protein
VTPDNAATTTTLSIVTKANGAATPISPLEGPQRPLLRLLPIGWLVALLVGLYAQFVRARTRQLPLHGYAVLVPLALLLITGTVLAGCAGGGASNKGTPTGPAQLTITATSGTLTKTINVTLTVQ